jgi:hypothetical protein
MQICFNLQGHSYTPMTSRASDDRTQLNKPYAQVGAHAHATTYALLQHQSQWGSAAKVPKIIRHSSYLAPGRQRNMHSQQQAAAAAPPLSGLCRGISQPTFAPCTPPKMLSGFAHHDSAPPSHSMQYSPYYGHRPLQVGIERVHSAQSRCRCHSHRQQRPVHTRRRTVQMFARRRYRRARQTGTYACYSTSRLNTVRWRYANSLRQLKVWLDVHEAHIRLQRVRAVCSDARRACR